MIGNAGVFFKEFFDAFATRMATRVADCSCLFGVRNKPKFTKARTVLVYPSSSDFSVPLHAGNNPLQLYWNELKFVALVRSQSFSDAKRLQQVVISAFCDTRDVIPFTNCTFAPLSETFDEQTETDAYEEIETLCSFGSPVYYGEDDMPAIGQATEAIVISTSVT